MSQEYFAGFPGSTAGTPVCSYPDHIVSTLREKESIFIQNYSNITQILTFKTLLICTKFAKRRHFKFLWDVSIS